MSPVKASKVAKTAKADKPVKAANAPKAAKPAADALSPRALNRATLARQMLLRREKLKPRVAIERLLCLQAQIARPPFLAL